MTEGSEREAEETTGECVGRVQRLRVREPGPDSDGPVLEIHGSEGLAAMEVADEAFVEGLTRWEDLRETWSDDDLPELTDDQILDGLLDTVDAVEQGYYADLVPPGDDRTDHDGPWRVRYRVWEKSDQACGSREGGHTGEKETFEGFFDEPSPIDCVNAIVYELRGTKSEWELAYIDEIEPVGGGDDD